MSHRRRAIYGLAVLVAVGLSASAKQASCSEEEQYKDTHRAQPSATQGSGVQTFGPMDPETRAMIEKMLRGQEQEDARLGSTPEEIRRAKIERAVRDLKDADYVRRRGAAYALAQFGAKEYVKDVAELLRDEDARVRFVAAYALGELGAQEYARDIAELLRDEDANVRRDAAEALGKVGAKQYAKDIAVLLQDTAGSIGKGGVDFTVRGTAARALGRLGANEYAKDIARLLKDEQTSVRRSATQALKDLEIEPETGSGKTK